MVNAEEESLLVTSLSRDWSSVTTVMLTVPEWHTGNTSHSTQLQYQSETDGSGLNSIIYRLASVERHVSAGHSLPAESPQ